MSTEVEAGKNEERMPEEARRAGPGHENVS